jgi:hypothetical protein
MKTIGIFFTREGSRTVAFEHGTKKERHKELQWLPKLFRNILKKVVSGTG